jgi:hypothetical protein
LRHVPSKKEYTFGFPKIGFVTTRCDVVSGYIKIYFCSNSNCSVIRRAKKLLENYVINYSYRTTENSSYEMNYS